MEKRKLVVELIFEKFNLLSDADFKSWMLNNHEELYRLEREQIVDAWMDGMDGILHKIAAEKYYNETYGGQDEK
jgi:hypothetical protein